MGPVEGPPHANRTEARPDPFAVTVEEACGIVLRDLVMRGHARNSIAGHRQMHRKFVAFLQGQGVTTLGDVTEGLVESFQADLVQSRKKNGKPLALTTVAGHLGTLRVWGRTLVRLGYFDRSPCEWIEPPKVGRPLQDPVPTEDEILRLLAVPDVRVPRGYRDRTMLEVLYGAALRISELCDLDITDADVIRGTVTIREAKAGSSGIVPMGPVASEFVDGYLRNVRDLFVRPGEPRTALFLGTQGERIAVGMLEYMLDQWVLAAEITKRVTPHTLRAAAATHMLQRGCDLRMIQEYLRHRRLTSTERYLRLSGDRSLAEAYAKFHPRNRL